MRIIRTAVLCLVAATISLPMASAGRELVLSAKDIPPKIRQAAEGAVPGIVLDAVKLERAKDGIIYEVRGNADGKRYQIEVDKDGKVRDVQEDDGIALGDVPEAARKAAEKAVPGARLVEAAPAPGKGGEAAYVLDMLKDGKVSEVLVTAKGEVRTVKDKDATKKAPGKSDD